MQSAAVRYGMNPVRISAYSVRAADYRHLVAHVTDTLAIFCEPNACLALTDLPPVVEG